MQGVHRNIIDDLFITFFKHLKGKYKRNGVTERQTYKCFIKVLPKIRNNN